MPVARSSVKRAMQGARSLLAPALAAAALMAAIAGAQAQQPQSQPEARIIVTGEGSASVPPDYAQIWGGVSTRAKTVKEASDANAKAMAAITTTLLNAGIAQKDIQTSRFSIQPVYSQQDGSGPQKLSGYSVSNQVTVAVRDLGKVGDVLESLVGAGLTDIGNIAFLHSDPSKALDGAREAGIADARRKAELYAKASGVTLGRVAWITEDSGYLPPMPMGQMRAAVAKSAPVPISSGEDVMQVRITVGFDFAR